MSQRGLNTREVGPCRQGEASLANPASVDATGEQVESKAELAGKALLHYKEQNSGTALEVPEYCSLFQARRPYCVTLALSG